MENNYRVVRLLKNKLYPTYQLHAFLANKKTAPLDGLRLGALITMDWLRRRLGEDVPKELQQIPEPSAYKDVEDAALPSLHLSCGFVIDIVSRPEQGQWTLQITEPDLGPNPGTPEQSRPPVPGRVIETNVCFQVFGDDLECGFQTIISDPEGTEQQAEVYRLAIIRRLMEHPDFGLRQIKRLTDKLIPIDTVEELKTLASIWRDDGNHLPCVVFTHLREEPEKSPTKAPVSFPQLQPQKYSFAPAMDLPKATPAVIRPPYDMEEFARKTASYARTYLLSDKLLDRFCSTIHTSVAPGNIAVLEPDGTVRCLLHKPSKSRQAETMTQLLQSVYTYSRGREISFGRINFLSAARESLLRETRDIMQQSDMLDQQWLQRMSELDARYQDELAQRDASYQALSEQLSRQREYQSRLEEEKAQLREEMQEARLLHEQLLREKDEEIAYLKRKLSQPEEHDQVAQWVSEQFAGRLLLHKKAVDLLEDRSARDIDIELICDALDFLATDYWERRYAGITTDEMNTRCSEKYGRPFDVRPTGSTTIEFTPAQYKVKYFPGAKGKPVESPLDYHLGVGNDPENLLRIYFLHDDQKKLIVIGSLPRHLRAVTIK